MNDPRLNLLKQQIASLIRQYGVDTVSAVVKQQRQNAQRREREDALRSLGLTKCKGSGGETLWE